MKHHLESLNLEKILIIFNFSNYLIYKKKYQIFHFEKHSIKKLHMF